MEKKIEDLINLKREEARNKARLLRHDLGVANKLEHKFEVYVIHEKINMFQSFADELGEIINEINKSKTAPPPKL